MIGTSEFKVVKTLIRHKARSTIKYKGNLETANISDDHVINNNMLKV
jgi:hypothetical protein